MPGADIELLSHVNRGLDLQLSPQGQYWTRTGGSRSSGTGRSWDLFEVERGLATRGKIQARDIPWDHGRVVRAPKIGHLESLTVRSITGAARPTSPP